MDTGLALTAGYKSGWLGRDLSKDRISIDLTPQQLETIDALLQSLKARGLRPPDFGKADFSHPLLDDTFAALHDTIRDGRGLVILRRLPTEKYSIEDLEIVYWGIGTHVGMACSQSPKGDMIGYVTNIGNSVRGYTSDKELALHTDSTDVISLLSVRVAKSGGINTLASGLAIHEIMQREYPDELALLEQGWPVHRRGEQLPGEAPVTPYGMPIFAVHQGVLSCKKYYTSAYYERGLAASGQVMSAAEKAAFERVTEIGLRDEVRLDIQLEPGEAMFVNNFEVLHSRTAFEDWDDQARRRLLLRLWLEFDPPRPIRPEMFLFQNPSGRQGVDPRAAAAE